MSPALLTPLRRLAAMDPDERRFRAACELRKGLDRARAKVARPGWPANGAARVLASGVPEGPAALAARFAARRSAFPLDAPDLPSIADRVRRRFPAAVAAASADLDAMSAGRYDVLGYRGVPFGAIPDWHLDPVHQRRAPRLFWADVPYLDPAHGDHKIIWEINRHQHWLRLGRAHHLTGDPRARDLFVRQLESWLNDNPPFTGTNWASMLELAFRSLSWLWALHLFAAAPADDREAAWVPALLVGLDRQLTHVERNLSRYFSPNTHLTGEALALYVAGTAMPELAAAPRWAAVGRAVLVQEADRQVLADGGHAERSAHYHRYSTDFYLLALLVARRAGDPAAAVFERALRGQASYLRALADDRGRLPLLGDDDGGQLFPMAGRRPADCRDTLWSAAVVLDDLTLAIGPPPEETFWLCGLDAAAAEENAPAVPWPSAALGASGYYVSRVAPGAHLIFDAGPHGYLNGGHAHADALSVVLTVDSRPLLVDPGTATYTMDPALRDRFRSTAMHNTVVVDGAPQSTPRGPFHWHTRTDARAIAWKTAPGIDYAEGCHSGYRAALHHRAVLAVAGIGWFVIDRLLGSGRVNAEALWHLAPEWHVTSVTTGGAALRLAHADGTAQWIASSWPLAPLPEGHPLRAVAPEYGRVETAECLSAAVSVELPAACVTFIPAAGGDEHPRVDALDVETPPGEGWHGAAFRVRAAGCEAVLVTAVETDVATRRVPGRPSHPWGAHGVWTPDRVALACAGDLVHIGDRGIRVARSTSARRD